MTLYGLEIGTYEAFDKTIDKCLDFVYLHGILEHKNGFDLIGVTRETYNNIYSNSSCIIDVDIILHNGDKETGKLFFWRDSYGKNHGLVVNELDSENIQYVQDCFDKKVDCL